MLGANTQYFSEIIHFLENVEAKNLSSSFCCFDKTSEHGDRGSFTSPIVSKESKNLAIVHRNVKIIDSYLWSELFSQTLNSHALHRQLLSS
jgi:hypothetical protein